MNTFRSFSRFLAAFLAVCMAVAVPAAALADDPPEGTGAASGYQEEVTGSEVISQDISTEGSGVLVQATGGSEANGTVQGNIHAGEVGATVVAEAGSAAILIVGSVTSGGDGIQVQAYDGGQAAATASDVKVTGEDDSYGVTVESYGSGGIEPAAEEFTVVEGPEGGPSGGVEGFIVGEGSVGGAPAVEVPSESTVPSDPSPVAEEGSSGGGPTPEGGSSEGGTEDSIGTAPNYELTGGVDAVIIDPNAENREDKYHLPIKETVTDGSDASLAEAVVDSVTAPLGIHAASVGATSELIVEGGVTVTCIDMDDMANLVESDAGVVTVAIGGKVESVTDGFNVQASEGGWAVVAAGDVKAGQTGLDIENKGGTVSVNTNGITAREDGIQIVTSEEEGSTFVAAEGNVSSYEGYAVSIRNGNRGGTFVAVGGNASSAWDDPETGAGLFFCAEDADEAIGTNAGGAAVVLVTETLSGYNGVLVGDTPASAENLDLTVWQIKAQTDQGGVLIKGSEEQIHDLAKTISYIVKIEQPTEGGTISAKKADGKSDLDKKFDIEGEGGYEVSYEGQDVVLKISLQDGYEIKGAYNGEARIALQKDENGNYYLMVPRGGGILLQAILEKIKPTPEPARRPTDMNAPVALICLDAGGGILSGNTTFLKAVGKTFVFAEEPVWEGHTFLYWQSTIHPELRYHTGDKIVIQESDTFTAVWE